MYIHTIAALATVSVRCFPHDAERMACEYESLSPAVLLDSSLQTKAPIPTGLRFPEIPKLQTRGAQNRRPQPESLRTHA